jgi:adenosylcobinamide-GDP ribazoletransferase
LAFLTWFPAWFSGARLRRKSQRDISNSRAWFPLVGLFIGILLLLVQLVAFDLFSGFLTAAIVLFVLSAVTRGLHLDGLMDVCDGIFGGHTPERRLEIMKDPHVGAFGVVGLVLILLLKFGALASLNSNYFFGANSAPGWWSSVEVRYAPLWEVQGLLLSPGITLLLFPVLSRWSMVVSLGAFPYARTQGLGSPFHQGGIGISTAAAALMALALAVVLGGFGGLVLFVGVTALALAMGWAMTRSLGGLTGDCYGATNEVCEVAVLVAALALARYGWLETFGRAIGLGF